jgi:hypothetical protein
MAGAIEDIMAADTVGTARVMGMEMGFAVTIDINSMHFSSHEIPIPVKRIIIVNQCSHPSMTWIAAHTKFKTHHQFPV